MLALRMMDENFLKNDVRLCSTAAWSKCPGSPQRKRPPTTPEAPPLAQGRPLALKGETLPLGCQSEPALALWCLLKVADSTASDHLGAELPVYSLRGGPWWCEP